MEHISVKNKNRFWKIYFIILAIVIFLSAVYFFVFWNVMYSYENSLPETVLKAYLSDKENEVRALLGTAIDENIVLSEFDNREDAAGYLYDKILTGNISVSQNDTESSETRNNYTAYCGNSAFAHVVFSLTGEKSYGFEMSDVESFLIIPEFISEQSHDYDVVTPMGAELYFDEVRVDERYVTETGGQYPVDGTYESGVARSHFCDVWKITGMISNCDLKVVFEEQLLSEFVNISGQTVYLFPKLYYKDYIVTVPEKSDIKINGSVPLDSDITDEYTADYSDIYSSFDVKYGEDVKSVSYVLSDFLEEPIILGTFEGIELSVTKKNELDRIHLVYGWDASDTETVEIKVPVGTNVILNGKTVTDDYVNRAENYYNSEYFSSYTSDLPVWNVYVISGLSGNIEISVTDDDNVGLDILSDETDGKIRRVLYLLPESDFSDDEEMNFVCDFVKEYINYIGKGWSGIDENLSNVLSYMKAGTQSYSDVAKSVKAIVFNSPYKKITYGKIEATGYRYYGDGCFSCTVETVVDYLTSGGEEHSETDFEIYVAEINGYRRIVHMNIV